MYSIQNTWWIDLGATVHVANSLQGFRSTRTMQRSERHVKVANGVRAEVEAVGDLSLELADGFKLILRDCRCLTTDSLPRGYLGQYVRASAYAELDGERKRQSIYPGSSPRL